MPTPTVSPTTASQGNYTISNSSAFIAVFEADINALGEEGFTVTYPDTLTGVSVSLVHIDTTVAPPARLTVPLPAGGNVAHYNVAGENDPLGGGNIQLTVNINETFGSGTVAGELWELRVSADTRATWSMGVSSSNVDVNWLAVDPVAALTVPTDTFEQQPFSLNASNANLVSAVAGTVAGTLPATITPTYTWSYTGAIPFTELSTDTTTTATSLNIDPPGVYEPVPVLFTVATTFSDAAGLYTGFLSNVSDPTPSTVSQRRQQIVIVLDRSGSMVLENRYENAKIACRVLIHLFDGLRDQVNDGDRVAIVAFEDETAGFRGGSPSTRIQTLLPLSTLPAAVTAINNGTVDFGAPGTNTPIGDGLIAAIDLLGNAGPITDQRFSIILLTDGQENSGTVALVPASATDGAISFQTAVNASAKRQAVLDQSRCKLSAIALGPTADQSVLSQLAAFHAGEFALVSDPGELAGSFGHMLENSQTVNAPTKQSTPTTGVTDPDSVTPPAAPFVFQPVYFSTEPTADRLVLSVVPAAGTTVITDTIQLARWDGASYHPETVTIQSTDSDRATFVAKLPPIAAGHQIDWRVIRGGNPSIGQPLDAAQVLAYIDLHLRADVILDQPAYRTGDRMTLTVRIRQDSTPILGATVTATLDAPAVGLGEQLTAMGNVQVAGPTKDSKDVPTWMEQRIGTLLTRNKWHALPRHCPPGGLFVDGTDQLADPDGDGNYTNTFAQVFKEGTYTWTLSVAGKDANGNPFTRQLSISTFVSVKVDPRASKIKVTRLHNDPSGLLAAQVVVLPQDRRGEDLGPGKDDQVIFALQDGTFQHVQQHQPAPVQTDGTYQRVVLYTNRQRPTLLVKAAKVLLPEIDIRKQLLGLGD
jgi:hypothetical protein